MLYHFAGFGQRAHADVEVLTEKTPGIRTTEDSQGVTDQHLGERERVSE